MALPWCQVLSEESVLPTSSNAITPPQHSEGTPPLDNQRRRLDGIIWKYAPRSKHVHAPSYKNKTVAPHVDAWEKMVFFNPVASRHKKRRSAAYVALTAKDFDPTVMRACGYKLVENGREVQLKPHLAFEWAISVPSSYDDSTENSIRQRWVAEFLAIAIDSRLDCAFAECFNMHSYVSLSACL